MLCHEYDRAVKGGGWSARRPGRIIPAKDPKPTVQEARRPWGAAWTAWRASTHLSWISVQWTVQHVGSHID